MKSSQKCILDFFVSVVDNYGDMGFVCEYIQALDIYFPDTFEYIIWVNDTAICNVFVRQFGLDNIVVGDIVDFGKMRKSAIGISILHSPIPDLNYFENRALILRIDYISLDPIWIEKNETEHISSTYNRQIIELIPSIYPNSAGLIPLLHASTKIKNHQNSHIVLFCYDSSLDFFDFDSFPADLTVYIFSKRNFKQANIISLDFLDAHAFYDLLDSSEFVIIRGEVSFAHVIQSGVPFLWDMYKGIGGFPKEQSDHFLALLSENADYRDIHRILNQEKNGIITYENLMRALSHTTFGNFTSPNLIHTTKKYIDRFNNSI